MRYTTLLLATLSAAFAMTASAQDFVETGYVEMPALEPGAPVDGKLGREVAMARDTVLASAPQAYNYSGAVFVFDLSSDGQLVFRQELPTEGNTNRFGLQLAADGDFAAASEYYTKLRFYARNGGNWQQTQLLSLADVPEPANVDIRSLEGDLAMSGDLLAIGDQTAQVDLGAGPLPASGAVVLYRRHSSGQWQFEAVVVSPEPAINADFGEAVAVSGNTLLVGAQSENSAYVFERSGGQWQFARSLQSPGEGGFGWSVAVDGDLAVVGRRVGAIVDGSSNNGSFFGFERNLGGAGQWGLRGEYISSQANYIDNFSASLALRGPLLLAGVPGPEAAVFFVHRPDAGWEEVAVLDVADTGHVFGDAQFGAAVAFRGRHAVIGAPSSPDQMVGVPPTQHRWGSVHVWSDIDGGCHDPFDAIYCDGFQGTGGAAMCCPATP